jgi:hypothetical protein
VRPGPISTVPSSTLTFVELRRDNAICTPGVDENPGFVVCPPPFTAKGVLHDHRIFNCEKTKRKRVQRNLVTLGQVCLQFCSHPQPNLAPPNMQIPECSTEHSAKCLKYTGVRLGGPISFRRPQGGGGVRMREIYLRSAGDPCGNLMACVQKIRVGTILLGFKPRV